MNPRAIQLALVLVAIGSLAFLVFLVLVGGCGVPPLPAEPPFTVTTAADASRVR